MEKRTKLLSGAIWEDSVGYARAIRAGNTIEISGTVAASSGQPLYPGDAYAQTRHILNEFARILEEMGSCMADTVRTRMYVTDISRWEEIGRAHAGFFSHIQPCTTMVEVKALISPGLLIEIELSAIAGSASDAATG